MGKDQDFLEAARNGNTALIEKVLSQKSKRAGPLASLRRGPGVNVQDSGGYSALHHACLNGHVDIVRLLLSNEANPNLPDSRGSSPLHLAAWAGEEEIVNMLLSHSYRPANPNLQTIEQETPLHCAAQHGHTGALALLLQHEADPNMCNSRGETPLDLAAQYGRLQAVQLLIRSHPELIAPFTNAAIEHQQIMHQKSRYSSPLPTSGSMSTPSPSSPSFTMLMANSSPSTPSRLVFPHTCLHLASRNGHKNVVDVLLAAGLSVNLITPSGSALHEAALCGKENVVRTLLKAGIDLNATDAEGRTALDILQEFPPHVTKHIVAVINNYRNQMDTDDGEDVVVLRNHQPVAPQHHYQSLQHRNGINNNNNNNNVNTNTAHYQKQQHNTNYHFNSNNHLLNHSMHSMQQSSYNKQPRQQQTSGSNNFNGGKSLDSSLHPEEIAYAVVGGGHRYYPQHSPVHSHSNHSQNELGVSPSSSVSSFEPASVSPRSRSSTGGIIGSNPMHMTTFGPGVPPKKPPRRNLSVSPTHAGQHFSYTSPNHQLQPSQQQLQLSHNSALRQHRSSSNESPYSHQSHGSVGGMSFDETQLRDRQRSDRLFASARDSARSTSDDRLDQQQQQQQQQQNLDKNYHKTNVPKQMGQEKTSTIRRPTPAPRNISKDIINCENPTLKSYNPNRKLKRNRNSYSITLGDMDTSFSSGSNSDPKPDIPRSPTNYKQPPTPEHPPPSSSQAELTIHERIRPLSQEYKRRSALLNHPQLMIDSCTSPLKLLPGMQTDYLTYGRTSTAEAAHDGGYQTVGRKQGSSGSLSSNISCSSQSGSTDNVEEYVADSPFAGLLKGSTANVNKTACRVLQKHKPIPQTAEDQQKQRIRPPIPIKPIITDKKIFRPSQPAQKNADNEDEIKGNGNESESGVSSFDSNSKENANNEEKQPSQDNESTTISTDEQLETSNGDTTNSDSKHQSNILSPFNAEEARKKISEIIETFGSGILDSHLATSNDIELDFDETVVPPERHELALRLRNASLLHLERILFENGYDNFKFLNGVLEESDLEIIQISEGDASKLMKFVRTLPPAEFQPQVIPKSIEEQRSLNAKNIETLSGVGTLYQWLCSIYLPEYLETFNKHLYNNLDSVCGVWDVELQTVLEINKVGHRKRILRSLDYMRQSGEAKVIKTPLGENNDTNKPTPPTTNTKENRMSIGGYRKNRPAPQPPIVKTDEEPLQIRGPAELLLDLPANLRTKWRYSANVLLNEKIKYDVDYLGSTVVKELRGTESTRKSIKKLKRDERNSNSKPFMSSQTKSKYNLVRLAISHCGVEFIDINTKRTICEHEIQNINCACQDADDLRHFAYITKEHDLHYCHVFRVESTDLATDIILTLGQAFEVAYQLALRDGVQTHNTLTPHNNGTLRASKIPHN